MERAMGIEVIATWFFKDLRSRARTDLEGLGKILPENAGRHRCRYQADSSYQRQTETQTA